jgi:hypothetical protein
MGCTVSSTKSMFSPTPLAGLGKDEKPSIDEVETYVQLANAQARKDQLDGLKKLVKLCELDGYEDRLCQTKGVLDALLRSVAAKEDKELMFLGVNGLRYLAVGDTASKVLVRTPGVVDALLHAAIIKSQNEIKETGLDGLAVLGRVDESTRLAVFEYPGVVDALLKAAKSGETKQIYEAACNGIWNLTKTPNLADSMVDNHSLLPLIKDLKMNFFLAGSFLNLAVSTKTRGIMNQDTSIINLLIKASNSGDERTALLAKLALAILTGSDEKSKFLETGEQTLHDILKILAGTLEGSVVFKMTFLLNHPLVALRYLTTVDKNRKALGSEWLPQLLKAIRLGVEKDNALAAECALSCLTQYTFDENVIPMLRADPSYVECAQMVIESKSNVREWGGAANNARSALFKLEGKDELFRPTASKDLALNVMISYSWGPPPHENKKLAAIVESYLRSKGIKVWRDEGAMKSNILDAMADAVAQASIIFVLVTKTYKESPNCKLELTFAMKQRKKVVPLLCEAGYDFGTDGWLGLALGPFLYYDISNPKKRHSELEALVKKELDGVGQANALVSEASARLADSFRATIPISEEELQVWIASVGLDTAIADDMIREGYVGEEMIRALSEERTSEIKALLGLKKSATATKLKRELVKLCDVDQE